VKIEKRLAQLAVAAETLVIMKNARKPVGTRGRLPLTPRQVEKKIEQIFREPDTPRNRQRIYDQTKWLRKKREEYMSRAMKLAALNAHKRLTLKQLAELKRTVGDHSCEGSGCQLCGGQGLV
jgi:hypothetical protein